jgi:hypothetical protein
MSDKLKKSFDETYPAGSYDRYMETRVNPQSGEPEARFLIVDPNSQYRGTSLYYNREQLAERELELRTEVEKNPNSQWLQGLHAQYTDAIWDMDNTMGSVQKITHQPNTHQATP